MNLICKLTDNDIGETTNKFHEPEIRIGTRGIVLRDDGKTAIFNKSNKNEYKLPGGGVEGNESPEVAFEREVLEETGCRINNIILMGTAEEHKSKINFKQISYAFIGKVTEDTKKLNLTQKETDEGAKLIWETPEKALELIKSCYDNLIGSSYKSIYVTKFIVLRDRKILEYYIKNYRKS